MQLPDVYGQSKLEENGGRYCESKVKIEEEEEWDCSLPDSQKLQIPIGVQCTV